MANSYYLDWLKKAGINSGIPTDDLTESQIAERNKSNPLGGFGIMSAQQKAQRQLQQEALEKQVQYYQQQQQQALLAGLSSQGRIGHYAGQGIAGLIDAFRNRNQQPAAPSGPPQNDPELDRFTELAKDVGPAQAKIMLGQEMLQSGNQAGAALMQLGQKEVADQEEKDVDLKTKKLALAKPNPTVTKPGTDARGRPTATLAEILGRDSSGNNIYKDVSTGLKGTTRGSATDYLTPTQGGKSAMDFEGQMTQVENLLDINDRLLNLADSSPNAVGFQGKLASQANNLIYGFAGIRDIVAQNLDGTAKAKLASDDPTKQYKNTFDKIGGIAKDNSKVQTLLLEQAYLKATANGQKATDRDIENAIKTLGGNLNDPQAFKEILVQNRELAVAGLNNASKNTGPNGAPLSSTFAERLKSINQRRDRNVKESPALTPAEQEEYNQLLKELGKNNADNR